MPADTVEDGIALVEYFAGHLPRVLAKLGSVPPTRQSRLERRLRRVLARAGGEWLSRTAINGALGGHTPSEEIAAALDALEAAGEAERRTTTTGRRPLEEWRSLVAAT